MSTGPLRRARSGPVVFLGARAIRRDGGPGRTRCPAGRRVRAGVQGAAGGVARRPDCSAGVPSGPRSCQGLAEPPSAPGEADRRVVPAARTGAHPQPAPAHSRARAGSPKPPRVRYPTGRRRRAAARGRRGGGAPAGPGAAQEAQRVRVAPGPDPGSWRSARRATQRS